MGDRMLAVAGTWADGTITTMCNASAVDRVIRPGITAAAAAAGRPTPRIATVVAVTATSDVDAARQAAIVRFGDYGLLPRYRRMLEIGGLTAGHEIVNIGGVAEIRARIREYADAGVTDFLAAPFCVGPDPAGSWQRTIDVLGEIAPDLVHG